MTSSDQKCALTGAPHKGASAGGGGGQKVSASLIIQLPTTSASTQDSSDSIIQAPSSISSCQRDTSTRTLLTNQIAAHQSSNFFINNNNNRPQQQQQQRPADHHRYQQQHQHSSIDHHLITQGADSLTSSEEDGQLTTATITTTRTTTTTTTTTSTSTPPPNYHEIPGIVPSYHGRTSGPPPAYDEVVNPNAPPPSYNSLFGQVREARKSSNGLVDLLRQLFLVLIGTLGCTMIIGFLLLIPITMIFIGIFYINECRAENIPSFLVIGGFVWIMKNILNCYNQFKKDSTTINRPPPPRRPPPAVSNNSTMTTTTPRSPIVIETGRVSGELIVPQTSGPRDSSNPSPPTHQGQVQGTPQATTTSRQHIRHPPMIGLTSYKCESILNYFLIVWFLAGCIVVYRIYEPDYENPLSSSYCNRTVYLYAFWLMTSAFIIMAIILSCLCCLMASSLMSCSHGR